MEQLLTLPARHPFDADPPEREHGAVVVNMEESHLVEFLPQDEKHRVQILDALGDEVPPQSSSHLREREKRRQRGDNRRKGSWVEWWRERRNRTPFAIFRQQLIVFPKPTRAPRWV